MYLLAFKLHAAMRDDSEVMNIFEKIYENQHVAGDEILECFGILANNRMTEVAIKIGQHLLRACDKLVVDLDQQKKFILKFLFMFDSYITKKHEAKVEETLIALVETLGRIVSLEFLKHCSLSEVKVLFYSIWNIAYEAKHCELYKEC